jgi:hypothetical protein
MGAKLNSKIRFPKRFFYFSNRFVCLWQKVLIIFEPMDAKNFLLELASCVGPFYCKFSTFSTYYEHSFNQRIPWQN